MEISVPIETRYPLHWAWGCVARGAGHTKPSSCLFGVCGPLRNLRKVHHGTEVGCFCGKVSGSSLGQVHDLGRVGVSGNYQDGANGIHQVNGEFRFGASLYLLVGSGMGSTKKWCLPVLWFLERATHTPAPPVLPLQPVNCIPPCMSLAL